jgi:predicted amidohydrolase YtcJ
LIFTGGRVHTVNASNDIAEAVAVAGDRIVAVGSNAEIRAMARTGTREVELRGRSLLPGFIDSHAHFAGIGGAQLAIDAKAPGMQSIAALQEAVRQRAAASEPGTWILGRGYDQTRLAEKRHPMRADWDAVAPEHPVLFTRTCGHIVSFNSMAMALAGLAEDAPDPEGGRYDRAGGRLLGVAYERATGPLRAANNGGADRSTTLKLSNDAYIAAGCTSVHDAGGLTGPSLNDAQEMIENGEIKVRLYAFFTINSHNNPLLGVLNTGVRTGFGNERLRIGAFKVVTDGSSSGPTAATRAPYDCDSDDSGIAYWKQDELDDLIGRAHRAGFQCTVHAVGDRAIQQTLDAMLVAQEQFPRQNLRHRIEHCAILPPDLQARVVAQGIVPSMQPAFFWEFGDGYIANYGQHRADIMFPVKSMTRMGVRVAGGTDAPVTHYAPLFAIEQAMTRATMDGQVCGPDECVDLDTAIRLHTINGAYASFEENLKGSIEVGKLADLTLLEEDLSRVPVTKIRHTGVAMTVIGGEVVYEA